MEMDLGSTVIGIIAIMICALSFVMSNRSKKKREKKFLQSLSKIAAQNECQIDQQEIFGNFAIGIDRVKNFVFFSREENNTIEEQFVELDEIQSCTTINKSRTIKTQEGNQKVIERLELSFIPTASNKREIKWEFYNADLKLELYGELQVIEKWSQLINDRLK